MSLFKRLSDRPVSLNNPPLVVYLLIHFRAIPTHDPTFAVRNVIVGEHRGVSTKLDVWINEFVAVNLKLTSQGVVILFSFLNFLAAYFAKRNLNASAVHRQSKSRSIFESQILCAWRESNLYTRLRRPLPYPLGYPDAPTKCRGSRLRPPTSIKII